MSARLGIGLVLVIAGIVIAIMGYNDMNSLGNEVADALNVEENNGQLILAGGAAVAVLGAVLAFTHGRS